MPALLEYRGSCLVVDPKGQLAAITMACRQMRGQRVIVLNPFDLLVNELGTTAKYNPMAILDPDSASFGADCDSLADAIVLRDAKADSHWSDSARQLISGIIMHLSTHMRNGGNNLASVRYLISGPISALRDFVSNALDKDVEGLVRERLARFENITEESRELLGIISTANTQTGFISNRAISENLRGSDFRFRELKDRPTTVYLVLPAKYLDTCGKWFRLVVASALADLWNEPRADSIPVLAILDEFAQLGRLEAIQNAMGMAAGFGLRLWPIVQDLPQLKDLYGDRWETFLANAGVQQFFAPREHTTAEYISKLCGDTTIELVSESTSQTEQMNSAQSKSNTQGRSISQVSRPLSLPQEVRQLGDNGFLLFGEGVSHPILGVRIPYWESFELRWLARPDPYHLSPDGPPPHWADRMFNEWLSELKELALARGYDQLRIASTENKMYWCEPFCVGLTPAQTLDAAYGEQPGSKD